MRHNEAAGLRWAERAPLPKIDSTSRPEDGRRRRTATTRASGGRSPSIRCWRRARALAVAGVAGRVRTAPEGRGLRGPTAPRREAVTAEADHDEAAQARLRARGREVRTTHETRNSFLTLCSEDSPELEHLVKLIPPARGRGGERDLHAHAVAGEVPSHQRSTSDSIGGPSPLSIPRAVGADADVSADIGQREPKSPCSKAGARWGSGRTRNYSRRRAPKESRESALPVSRDTPRIVEVSVDRIHADQSASPLPGALGTATNRSRTVPRLPDRARVARFRFRYADASWP